MINQTVTLHGDVYVKLCEPVNAGCLVWHKANDENLIAKGRSYGSKMITSCRESGVTTIRKEYRVDEMPRGKHRALSIER